MKFAMTLAALAAFFGLAGAQLADAASARREPNGAVRFYDDNGSDRGYAWCRQRGGFGSMNPADCSYYTLRQCQASAVDVFSFNNQCTPNPYASQVQQPRRRR